MSKRTYKNPKPIEVILENIEGKEIELQGKVIDPVLMEDLEQAALDSQEGKFSFTKLVLKQMVMIFGKEEKFYNQFDFTMLNSVLNDITEDIKKKMYGGK